MKELVVNPKIRCVLQYCGAMLIAVAGAVQAQSWPVKPVRVIVPFPPGATLDIMTRLVAQKAAESTGQPFVVENRAGANGQIGSEVVARSAPDGYTILATTTSTHISAPFLVKIGRAHV